jgi:hypothetical protein
MPPTCTICTHANRTRIDRALVSGEASIRDIAGQWSVSKSALSRHRNHIPAALTQAAAAAEIAAADNLIEHVRDLQSKTVTILDSAMRSNDHRVALQAIGQARANIALLAELTEQLDRRPVVNLLLAPEWGQVRSALLVSLSPYPAARIAAATALESVGGGGTSGR